jgi:hypothetical protein
VAAGRKGKRARRAREHDPKPWREDGQAIDLVQDPAKPFSYPLDTGLHLIHFVALAPVHGRPRHLHTNGNDPSQSFPARPSTTLFTTTAGLLGKWNWCSPAIPSLRA